jgi:CHAT domain-containing protein
MAHYLRILLVLLLIASCTAPPPLYVEPLRDSNATAAGVWAADLETVADAIGIGRVLFQDDPRKLTGVAYCDEGNRLADQGEFRAALRAKSEALYLSGSDSDYMLTAHCAAGIALIYDYVGDNLRSLKWAGFAQDYLARAPLSYGDPRPSYIKTMVLKVQSDAAKAEERLPEALNKMEAALAVAKDNPPLISWIKLGLANILAQSEPERAIPLLNQVIAEDPNAYRAIAWRVLGSIELDSNAPQAQSIFTNLASTARAQGDDYTLCWAEQGLAHVAVKLGQPLPALEHYRLAVEAADRVRAWFHTEEFRSSTFGSLQEIFDEAVNLNMRSGRFVEAFEIAEQSRARSLRDMMHDTTKEATQAGQIAARIQNALPTDTTLVSYYVLPHRLYIWKISRTDVVGLPVTVEQAALKLLTTELHGLLQFEPLDIPGDGGRTELINSKSRVLWEYLIKPLSISPGTKLIVVPHRFLHFLPFVALRDKTWLIRDHQLSFAPSAAAWLEAGSRVRPGMTMLAFGNPDTAEARKGLPGAETEINGIKQVIPQAEIALRLNASRERFVKSAAQYNILHFAAHAKVDSIDSGASALLLAGPTPQESRLEAKDIYRFELPHASLVTMSACDTALGAMSKGDEVYSLTSAFIAAGAKNVITTLWPVSDEATPKLMVLFYQNIVSGMEYAEALRQAQLGMAADQATEDPAFWAAFELVGAGGR